MNSQLLKLPEINFLAGNPSFTFYPMILRHARQSFARSGVKKVVISSEQEYHCLIAKYLVKNSTRRTMVIARPDTLLRDYAPLGFNDEKFLLVHLGDSVINLPQLVKKFDQVIVDASINDRTRLERFVTEVDSLLEGYGGTLFLLVHDFAFARTLEGFGEQPYRFLANNTYSYWNAIIIVDHQHSIVNFTSHHRFHARVPSEMERQAMHFDIYSNDDIEHYRAHFNIDPRRPVTIVNGIMRNPPINPNWSVAPVGKMFEYKIEGDCYSVCGRDISFFVSVHFSDVDLTTYYLDCTIVFDQFQIDVTLLIHELLSAKGIRSRPIEYFLATKNYIAELVEVEEHENCRELFRQKLFELVCPEFSRHYSAETIEYYERYFGFNPVAEVLAATSILEMFSSLDDIPNEVNNIVRSRYIEKDHMAFLRWHKLDPTTPLGAAGIEIGSLVTFTFRSIFPAIKNRILFRKVTIGYYSDGKNREEIASVDCVHTAISVLTPEQFTNQEVDEYEIAEEAVYRVNDIPIENVTLPAANGSIKLDPADHFISLNSYVQSIAEFGIEQLIIASYHSDTINPETLPFGFNSEMQSQVVQALISLCKEKQLTEILVPILVEIVESVPEDWLKSRWKLLDKTYHISRLARQFPDKFKVLFSKGFLLKNH